MDARAVIFDLDGTLLDTLADIAAGANEALAANGLPTHPDDAFRQFIGEGVVVLMKRAVPPDRATDALIRKCVVDYQAAYAGGWNVRTRPYAGVPEMLDALASRGLGLAVLSNKPDAFTRLCVGEYLGRWPFRAVLGQRDGVPRKPDPAGAFEAARLLGVEPERVVYVGDSATDMETARAARMTPVGVSWGFRPADELRAHGALAILGHPLDLPKYLDEIAGDRHGI